MNRQELLIEDEETGSNTHRHKYVKRFGGSMLSSAASAASRSFQSVEQTVAEYLIKFLPDSSTRFIGMHEDTCRVRLYVA
jgi:hypothetical protein